MGGEEELDKLIAAGDLSVILRCEAMPFLFKRGYEPLTSFLHAKLTSLLEIALGKSEEAPIADYCLTGGVAHWSHRLTSDPEFLRRVAGSFTVERCVPFCHILGFLIEFSAGFMFYLVDFASCLRAMMCEVTIGPVHTFLEELASNGSQPVTRFLEKCEFSAGLVGMLPRHKRAVLSILENISTTTSERLRRPLVAAMGEICDLGIGGHPAAFRILQHIIEADPGTAGNVDATRLFSFVKERAKYDEAASEAVRLLVGAFGGQPGLPELLLDRLRAAPEHTSLQRDFLGVVCALEEGSDFRTGLAAVIATELADWPGRRNPAFFAFVEIARELGQSLPGDIETALSPYGGGIEPVPEEIRAQWTID